MVVIFGRGRAVCDARAQQPRGDVQRREPERAAGGRGRGGAAAAVAAAAHAAGGQPGPSHALLRWAGVQPPGLLASLGALRAGRPTAHSHIGFDHRSAVQEQ